MRIAILCQEEPVFLGPIIQGVIRHNPTAICAVFIAGSRKAGEKSKTLKHKLDALLVYYLILGLRDFLTVMTLRLRCAIFGKRDPSSVERVANAHRIPVYHVGNPNQPAFLELLQSIQPDIVLNQSEMLLKSPVLAIPRIGFINRHASLLPRFRGRLASFWSHTAKPPSYGMTIHFVDEGVDTGPIILQKAFPDCDPTWSYLTLMQFYADQSPGLIWEAIHRLQQPDFIPIDNMPIESEPVYKFPTVQDARHYRIRLNKRRKH